MTEETPLAARFAQQKAKVGNMAEILDRIDDASIWTSMTCEEIESIADVIRFDGQAEIAERIVAMHATEDEPGDFHFVKKHTVVVEVGWRGDLTDNVGDLIRDSLLENFDHAEMLSAVHPQ